MKETIRKELWCKVYATIIIKGTKGKATAFADGAIKEYDKRVKNGIL